MMTVVMIVIMMVVLVIVLVAMMVLVTVIVMANGDGDAMDKCILKMRALLSTHLLHQGDAWVG